MLLLLYVDNMVVIGNDTDRIQDIVFVSLHYFLGIKVDTSPREHILSHINMHKISFVYCIGKQ